MTTIYKRLTSSRETELRKIHTDNRYGVLELLEEIGVLREELKSLGEVFVSSSELSSRVIRRLEDSNIQLLNKYDDLMEKHHKIVSLPECRECPKLRDALKAIKQDAIECNEVTGQWVFSKWALDKVDEALKN